MPLEQRHIHLNWQNEDYKREKSMGYESGDGMLTFGQQMAKLNGPCDAMNSIVPSSCFLASGFTVVANNGGP
jgi:hypothetical protein